MMPCLAVECERIERANNVEKILGELFHAAQARTRWLVHAHLCQALGYVESSLESKTRKNNGASNSSLFQYTWVYTFQSP